METTPNYGLKKPTKGEFYNLDEINENTDIIDKALKTLNDNDTAIHIEQQTLGSTEEEIDNFYNTYSDSLATQTLYRTVVWHPIEHSVLGGGTWILEGHKIYDHYEMQSLTGYGKSRYTKYTRTKIENVWTPWKAVDIGGILAQSKTVYVDTNGNDRTGDGTQANPWQTIQKAVDECPTNTNSYTYDILLAGGVYDEEVYIRDKTGRLHIKGADTVADSENYTVKCIQSEATTYLRVTGIKFTGNSDANSKVGLAGTQNTMLYVTRCKFEDCIVRANAGGDIHLLECELSNYQSGLTAYGAVHANGGTIKCYGITGTNNKCGYGGGVASATGGNIYIYGNSTLKAETLIKEEFCGRVQYNTGRYAAIGQVAGASSVEINPTLYAEFLVKVNVPNFGKFEYVITSSELTFTAQTHCTGTMLNATTYAHTSIQVSTTAITLNQAVANGVSVLTTATMTVYGKR